MNYIEVTNGLSIRIDEIEAVSQGEDTLTSIVRTHHNIYKSTFPYQVLLDLLESNSKEDIESKELQQKPFNILREIGTFAG